MRKLQFTINNQSQQQATQTDVAQILAKDLNQFGFQTSQKDAQVAIRVDNSQLPLSVACQDYDQDGHLLCEISSNPAEDQDWLDRITERSLLNQLAQAVENTLKKHEQFDNFKWKEE